MREVYVLMRDVGEYSDRDESPVLATLDGDEAEACLAMAQAHEWPSRLDIYDDECDDCAPEWETADALALVRSYGTPCYRLVTVRLMMAHAAPPGIPRDRVEALLEAVTRRMEQLDAAGSDTHFASERDIYTACRSDLAEVAESLRLMLTECDHG